MKKNIELIFAIMQISSFIYFVIIGVELLKFALFFLMCATVYYFLKSKEKGNLKVLISVTIMVIFLSLFFPFYQGSRKISNQGSLATKYTLYEMVDKKLYLGMNISYDDTYQHEFYRKEYITELEDKEFYKYQLDSPKGEYIKIGVAKYYAEIPTLQEDLQYTLVEKKELESFEDGTTVKGQEYIYDVYSKVYNDSNSKYYIWVPSIYQIDFGNFAGETKFSYTYINKVSTKTKWFVDREVENGDIPEGFLQTGNKAGLGSTMVKNEAVWLEGDEKALDDIRYWTDPTQLENRKYKDEMATSYMITDSKQVQVKSDMIITKELLNNNPNFSINWQMIELSTDGMCIWSREELPDEYFIKHDETKIINSVETEKQNSFAKKILVDQGFAYSEIVTTNNFQILKEYLLGNFE